MATGIVATLAVVGSGSESVSIGDVVALVGREAWHRADVETARVCPAFERFRTVGEVRVDHHVALLRLGAARVFVDDAVRGGPDVSGR